MSEHFLLLGLSQLPYKYIKKGIFLFLDILRLARYWTKILCSIKGVFVNTLIELRPCLKDYIFKLIGLFDLLFHPS